LLSTIFQVITGMVFWKAMLKWSGISYHDNTGALLVKQAAHRPTEFGSTVWTLANDANDGRVAWSLRLELATFLGGHYEYGGGCRGYRLPTT
jgi:hypothetical protein